ncbi:hypothetical protein BLOT_004185 [Blomia tropicalis]|nr:hypothetical protein BLOT_004185 [Blomia tropicalis]
MPLTNWVLQETGSYLQKVLPSFLSSSGRIYNIWTLLTFITSNTVSSGCCTSVNPPTLIGFMLSKDIVKI